MGLLERNREILRRMEDLRPLSTQARERIVADKRDQLIRGVDVDGRPFKEIAPATRKGRSGGGPPLAPTYGRSDIVTKFDVRVERVPEGLKITMSWPGWIKYHVKGGPKIPRRDPRGLRERTRRALARMLRDWVMDGRS